MQLNELNVDKRFFFENVPCKKLDDGAIFAENGRLEERGLEEIFFRSRNTCFAFKITNDVQRKAVKDCLNRRFIGLANVSIQPKAGEKFFWLRIIFFMRAVRFNTFQVILSNSVREKLHENGYDVTNYGKPAQIFQFDDGVSDEKCFAFISTLPPKEESDVAPSEENLPTQKEFKPDEKVFQIEGNNCKLLVRLEVEDSERRATAYRVIFNRQVNQNEQLALQLAYGSIDFSDEKSIVSARVSEILQESPNYISIWNEYTNREGNFLLQQARAVGEISYLPKFNQTDKGTVLTLINPL